MFSTWMLCLGLVVLPVALFTWYRHHRQINSVDGVALSRPDLFYPVIGHILSFANLLSAFQEICQNGADENGFSCFYLLSKKCIGITDCENIKDVLLNNTFRENLGHFNLHLGKLLGDKNIMLLHGSEWKAVRNSIARAFRWENLRKLTPEVNRQSNRFVVVLSKKMHAPVDMFKELKDAMLDVIGICGFGYDFGCMGSSTRPPIASAFTTLLREFARRQISSIWNPFDYNYDLSSSNNKNFKEASKSLRDIVETIVLSRRQSTRDGIPDEHSDMLKFIMECDHNLEIIDNQALVESMLTMLFGGFDTGSVVLTFVFYLIATNPDVQELAVKEINQVLGAAEPTFEDLTERLPYCNAIISEASRLYPPGLFTIRTLEKPMRLLKKSARQRLMESRSSGSSNPTSPSTQYSENIDDYVFLQAGEMIVVPFPIVNRSPESYESPNEFRPERFLPENTMKRHRYSFLTFSGGIRDCVGQRFAMIQLVSMFVATVRKYTFTPVDGYVLKTTSAGILQKPIGGMPLNIGIRK